MSRKSSPITMLACSRRRGRDRYISIAFRQTAETTLRKLDRGIPMSLHTRLFLALLAIAFIALVASWPAFAQTGAGRC
jgi:hypothetical protein